MVRFKINFLVLLLSISYCTLAADFTPLSNGHVIVVFAEDGKATESASVEIEPGSTLASLFLEKRPVPKHRPLNIQQGFVEIRRLPAFKREGLFQTFTNAEIRSKAKGGIPLEDGDIIISDAIGDY